MASIALQIGQTAEDDMIVMWRISEAEFHDRKKLDKFAGLCSWNGSITFDASLTFGGATLGTGVADCLGESWGAAWAAEDHRCVGEVTEEKAQGGEDGSEVPWRSERSLARCCCKTCKEPWLQQDRG